MRWLIFFLAILFIGQARATEPDALTRIGMQIEQYSVVRAEFTQSKQIAVMKLPLVTTGRLTYSRKHGVLWQIEQPFRMSYVLGEDKIVEIGADGMRRERGMRDVPGLAQVARVFRAMLGANTTALQEYFDATAHGNAGKWEIELKPRQSQLAQFLTGLQLSGGRFVDSIRISETSGDTTQIHLHNSHGTSAPSEAELQLFGGEQSVSHQILGKP